MTTHASPQPNRREQYAEAIRECAVYDSEERLWRSLSPEWVEEITTAVTAVEDPQQTAEFLGLATEFRLPPTPPAFTPLIVRRDLAYDGTQWAVLHDPGDLAVRRAWTPDGWEMAWALADAEIYCWPDGPSALAAAKQAQANDDREPDIDGAGRTPESYRDRPTA